MTIEKKPAAHIWEAITRANINEIEKLFQQNPDQINAHIPFAGGTFLHLAASEPSLEVVKYLIKIGFEINKKSTLGGAFHIARSYASWTTTATCAPRKACSITAPSPPCSPAPPRPTRPVTR